MDMDVRSARCFLMLVEERNFRRAAQRLHMTQPHLSRMMRDLEVTLGVSLLNRVQRRFELTDAGRVFLDAGQKLVACAEECERRVMAFTTPGHQPLVVGFDQHALAEFAPLFSDAAITPRLLLPIPGDDPVLMLQRRKLHLTLAASRPDYGGLSTSLVLSEPYMLALPNGGEAPAVPVSLRQQHLQRIILPATDRSLRPWLVHHEIDVPGIVEVSSFTEAIGLASLGVGAAIIPASYQKLGITGVAFHKIAEPLPPSEVIMAWRDGSVPENLLDGLRSWHGTNRPQ